MPTEVRDVIDRIYDQHNKLVDLSPAEMVNASEVLLRFLSDPKIHPSGQHVFKDNYRWQRSIFYWCYTQSYSKGDTAHSCLLLLFSIQERMD